MLLNLHVKNLAVIDEIEVEFSDGLNVLTGETGAGKSIIIGSINIALGGKVSRDIIRKGTEFALIELTFLAETDEQICELEKLGISLEENMLVISRKVTKSRTINRVNGETVNVSMLKSVADILIDRTNSSRFFTNTSIWRLLTDMSEKRCTEKMSNLVRCTKNIRTCQKSTMGKRFLKMSVLEKFHLLNMNWNRLRMLIL